MFRPSILLAVTACTAALLAPPAHAQPTSPPPPPPGPVGPPGPPPTAPPYGGQPYAQPAPPQPVEAQPFERRGWFIGFGLGAGGISDENADSWSGGEFNAYFGGMLNPRVALVVELALGAYQSDEYYYDYYTQLQRNTASFIIGGQFFLGERIWLRGGLGSTRAAFVDDYGDTFGDVEGRTFKLGVGYELMQRESFALDVNLSMSATSFGDNRNGDDNTTAAHVGIGFSWY